MSFVSNGSPNVMLMWAPNRGMYLYGKGRPSGITFSKPVSHIGMMTGGMFASIMMRPLSLILVMRTKYLKFAYMPHLNLDKVAVPSASRVYVFG